MSKVGVHKCVFPFTPGDTDEHLDLAVRILEVFISVTLYDTSEQMNNTQFRWKRKWKGQGKRKKHEETDRKKRRRKRIGEKRKGQKEKEHSELCS